MKKSVSTILILAMVFCLTITGFAMTGSQDGKITGMAQGLALGYSGSGDLGEVYPQDERVEYIYLYDSMFEWDNGYVPSATPTQLTTSQIRAAKLEARSTRSTSKVLDSISVNARESRIEIKFADEYVGTKELDFDFDVVLSINGRRQAEHAMNFSSTFLNSTVEVYDGYESVDISDGSVAHAQETISKLDVEIGCGVTISTRLSKDKKIYATATMTPASKDEEIMKDHSGIAEVITLRTAGLSGSSTVKMGPEYAGYHIYNEELEYLGAGKDKLELAGKYYLATKLLDIEFNEPDTGASSQASSQSSSQAATPTTDTQYPSNANDNPATGR